jgi:hypothetical protein
VGGRVEATGGLVGQSRDRGTGKKEKCQRRWLSNNSVILLQIWSLQWSGKPMPQEMKLAWEIRMIFPLICMNNWKPWEKGEITQRRLIQQAKLEIDEEEEMQQRETAGEEPTHRQDGQGD